MDFGVSKDLASYAIFIIQGFFSEEKQKYHSNIEYALNWECKSEEGFR